MSELKNDLLKQLGDCVVEMEEDAVSDIARTYMEHGFNAYEGISDGLAVGMAKAGELFEEEEYYIPELLICSDVMYEGIAVLKENIKASSSDSKLKAVVGVVEGDTHDIGKNIFKIMLEANGFEVYDLGRDVPCMAFIDKAKEVGAHLISMSTLMTTTMENMAKVVDLLEEHGIRKETVVMVGGGPISRSFADSIGADGYEREAAGAAKLAKKLVELKQQSVAC